MPEQQTTPGTGSSRQGQSESGQGTIALERLAEKVYQLMKADARLSRARGQKRPTGR